MSTFAVAIIADAHYHDARADFSGAGLLVGGQRLALRSWKDTRTGPRAVNETALALTAALDRAVAMGIRHVVLAGDYSDDGQVANTKSLAALLRQYQNRHALRIYVIPGNHDLYGPYGKHVATRFVAGPDRTLLVTSDPVVAATEPDAVLTPEMRCEGQAAALLQMADFGVCRHPSDVHWESPFGPSDAFDARQYDAQSADGSVTQRLMDASYLVEPEPGLWILMLDANVFEPRSGRRDATRKKAFIDPADAGWTAVLRQKPFLLAWIRDVTTRAAAGNKTLITVSHYPVLDPFQDKTGSEAALFGTSSYLRRTPDETVAGALTAAGLTWHAGGHLHINSTTSLNTRSERLTDISVPSLSAYPPAFKILRASTAMVCAETVLLDNLPSDPVLHQVYRMEGCDTRASNYAPFLLQQFRTRVAEHTLPRCWPNGLWQAIKASSSVQLLAILGMSGAEFSALGGLSLQALGKIETIDLIVDAYLIRAAGPLAGGMISPDRMQICRALARVCGDDAADPHESHANFLRRFLAVLTVSLDRMAADDTVIWQKTPSLPVSL